jgi:hypothetical protein
MEKYIALTVALLVLGLGVALHLHHSGDGFIIVVGGLFFTGYSLGKLWEKTES